MVTELYGLGAEVAPAVDLRLATAAGERRVLVRPGRPVNGAVGVADAAAAAGLPWLAGIDRLEQPDDTARFVTSRTLYRRLGRFIWVPPLLAVVVAVLIRMAFVYHGVYHLVHRASGPRRVLVRAYSASWTNRFLFTLAVVVALELAVAALVAVVSRRVWRAHGGGDLPAPWAPRPWSEQWADADESPASSELEVCGTPALDEARSLVADGATGLVTGGGLRAELTHLGTGFFACPGGTTELVREHPGTARPAARLPPPPPGRLDRARDRRRPARPPAPGRRRPAQLDGARAARHRLPGREGLQGGRRPPPGPGGGLAPRRVLARRRRRWRPTGCGCAGSGGWRPPPSSWPGCSTSWWR